MPASPSASASVAARIRVWMVAVDGRKWSFDSLDTAMAYLRAEVGTNGAAAASIESAFRTRGEYNEAVEREEARVSER